MRYTNRPKNNGFTLVELLVVIVIIAALAALSITVGPRMMGRAQANEAMQNLRQLGPLFSAYASDHGMKLPPAKGPATQPDGTTVDLQWNEICLALLYPRPRPPNSKRKPGGGRTRWFLTIHSSKTLPLRAAGRLSIPATPSTR